MSVLVGKQAPDFTADAVLADGSFGEISLSGDVRPVSRSDSRLKEAAKLGFGRALGPAVADGAALPVTAVTRLADAVQRIGDETVSPPQ